MPTIDQQLTEVTAERDRLKRLLTEVERFKLEATPGEITVELQGHFVELWVAMLAGWFQACGGVNFVTATVQHPELGPMEVTVRRTRGKTPAQIIAELREELRKAPDEAHDS